VRGRCEGVGVVIEAGGRRRRSDGGLVVVVRRWRARWQRCGCWMVEGTGRDEAVLCIQLQLCY